MAARLPWVKVDANLRNHPKALALQRLLVDHRADLYLPDLWMWATQNCPTGRIIGAHASIAIESACRWMGEPGALTAAFVATGWLDEVTGGLYIHDWAEHAGAHIAKAEKDAALAAQRQNRKRLKSEPAPSHGGVTRESRVTFEESRGSHARVTRDSCVTSPSLSLSQVVEGVQGETRPPLPDASHLEQQVASAFQTTRGRPYRWQRDELQGLGRLLNEGEAPEEILRRWGVGLRRTAYPRCDTVKDLVRHWNAYAAEASSPGRKGLGAETSDEEFKRKTANLKTDENGDLIL